MSSNSFLVADGYGPLVAGQVEPPAVTPPTRTGMIKHPNSASSYIWSVEGARSSFAKVACPTAFTHVRLHLYSDLAFSGATMAVAPTSVGALDTADHSHKPHNAQGQIDTGLWQTGTLPDITAEAVAKPNPYAPNSMQSSVSEWFAVESLEGEDGNHYVLLRMTTPNGGYSSVGDQGNNTLPTMRQWFNASDQDYYRMFCATGGNPDVIGYATDLNAYPGGALNGGYCHLFAVEFGIAEESNAITMLMTGDSISADGKIEPPQGFNVWGEVAFSRALGAANVPWFFTNAAMSGRAEGYTASNTENRGWGYGNHYNDITNQGVKFDWVLCPAFTPNGADPYVSGREQEHYLWLDWIVAKTATEGSNLILWEGIPNQGYAESSDVIRRRINAYAGTLAENNSHVWYILLGSEVTIPDQLPARMIPEYNADTFHLNTIGNGEGMAPFAQARMNNIILNVFEPPTAAATSTPSVAEGGTVNLDGSGTTIGDGAIVSRLWTVSPSSGVVIADATAETTTATMPAGAQNYTWTYTVTDENGESDSATTTTAVSETPNVGPTASATTNTPTVTVDTAVTLDASGSTDSDGAIASYAWTQVSGPSTASFSSTTAVSPTVTGLSAEGAYVFRVTVTDDDGATDSAEITITAQVLVPPVADAGANQSVAIGSSVQLDSSSSSDDNGIASRLWQLLSGPVQIVFDDDTAAQPNVTFSVVGTYIIQVTITDTDGLTDTDTVTITVGGVAPTADAGAGGNVEAGATFILDATGSDDDTEIVSFSWAQVSGSTAVISDNSEAITSVTAPSVSGPENLVFEVTVTDSHGLTDTALVTFIVRDTTAPSIMMNQGTDTILMGEDWVDAGALVTDNIDPQRTIYADAVPPMLSPGVYQIPYTATDSAGNTAVRYRTVTVSMPQQSTLGGELLKGTFEPGSYQVRLYKDAFDSGSLVLDSTIFLSGKTFNFAAVTAPAGTQVLGFALHPTYGGVPIMGVTQ